MRVPLPSITAACVSPSPAVTGERREPYIVPRSGVQLVQLTPVRQCASGRSGKSDHLNGLLIASRCLSISILIHWDIVGLVPSPGIQQGGRLKVGQVKLTNSLRCSANAFPNSPTNNRRPQALDLKTDRLLGPFPRNLDTTLHHFEHLGAIP